MLLNPVWRTRFFTAAAVLAAVWIGSAVAEGSGVPAAIAMLMAALLLARWLGLSFSTMLLGFAVFGFIAGNRGFAQLYVSNLLPILPAEGVLAVAGGMLAMQSAWRRELPFRSEPLNMAVLLWIILGTLRIGFDVRTYGFAALRDFATVYYAAFFFVAQEAGRDPAGRTFLTRSLLVACTLLLPLWVLYQQMPEFFLGTFTLRGIPLVFLKGDLVGTYFAVGAVLLFLRGEAGGSRWNTAIGLTLAGAALATNNRASMLGLLVATAWLLVGGRWRFAATQAAAGVLASALILFGAFLLNVSWERTPVYGLYERTASLVDFSGDRIYRSEDSLNKGDNNRFRRVWWGAVIDQTIEGNPWVGLGFGADLAGRFVREYYADSSEDFTTRSPHNILLTVFARMGLTGLLVFLTLLGIIAQRTWRAVRTGPTEAGLWCAAWVVIASACLGVVLEGPMGAVVFWTVLGLANSQPEPPEVAAETA